MILSIARFNTFVKEHDMTTGSTGTTKGYTLQYFINLVSNTTNSQYNRNSVYDVISPTRGFNSVRSYVLDTWLNNATTSIVEGTGVYSTFGKTPRTRLLKALRNRKTTGTVL